MGRVAYILIVDDEEPARAALERTLTQEGHRVCWASNGQAALKHMRIEKPDLVLLDMLLTPEMDGWELLTAKGREKDIATIPVIIVSGLSQQEIHRRQEKRLEINPLSGINVMLEKPFDGGKLKTAIDHILRLREIERDPF